MLRIKKSYKVIKKFPLLLICNKLVYIGRSVGMRFLLHDHITVFSDRSVVFNF